MKQALLLIAAIGCMFSSTAKAQRQMPVYNGCFVEATDGDTLYLYNTGAAQFCTYGNDWGTHVSVGARGVMVVPQATGEFTAESTPQYLLRNYHPVKGRWYNMFLDAKWEDEQITCIHVYTDGDNTKPDRFFGLEATKDNLFRIYACAGNDNFYHGEADPDYYLAVDPEYVTVDGEQTGTGVVYASTASLSYNEWGWVSQADYAAYEARVEAYEKAEELLQVINEAEALDINVNDARAAYNNESLSVAELEAAIQALVVKLQAYYQDNVSPKQPIDMTRYIVNPGFEDGTNGWVNEAGFATFKQDGGWADMLDGTYFTGKYYLNLWHPSANKGRVVQTVRNLPNGVYAMTAAAYSSEYDVDIFAGSFSTPVVKGNIAWGDSDEEKLHMGQDYTVVALVTDGELEIGFKSNHEDGFWADFDNVRLMYYGAGEEAYAKWVEMSLAQAPSMEDARCQTSLVEKYNSALEALENAEPGAAMMEYVAAYIDVLNEVKANIAAYDALEAAITKASEEKDELYPFYTESVNSYLEQIAIPALSAHQLGTDEVNAITETLAAMVNDGLATYSLIGELIDLNDYLQLNINTYANSASEEARNAAEKLHTEVDELISGDTMLNNEMLRDYISRINDAIRELRIPVVDPSDDNPVDYTIYLVNPGFEEGLTGWEKKGQLQTCEKKTDWGADGMILIGAYLNMWDKSPNCEVTQTVTGLPNGIYSITASAFAPAENGMFIFANGDNVPVIAGEDGYGNRARYEVVTEVTDGTLRFGAYIYAPDTEFWCGMDEFTLTAYGPDSQRQPSGNAMAAVTPDGVNTLSASEVVATEVYTIAGTPTAANARGIQIVRQRLANGQIVTRKIVK